MSKSIRLLILALCASALAACAGQNTKPQIVATHPVVVPLTQRVYVPIDPKLTAPLAVPEGPLSQCPDIGALRRAVIEKLNARLLQISKVQNTEVPPGK